MKNRFLTRWPLLLAIVFLTTAACQLTAPSPAIPVSRPTALMPAVSITARPRPTSTQTIQAPARATVPVSTAASSAESANDAFDCAYNPITAQMVAKTSAEDWLGWVKRLSGAEPVTVSGKTVTITTRYTPAMFSGQPGARAFDYVLETVRGWYPEEQIEVQPWTLTDRDQHSLTAKNLILSLPGKSRPDEVVILSAHLDSFSHTNPNSSAPGAEDNASGSAALLEAARVLRGHTFERTLRIIWFTGEEEGLLGSEEYVKSLRGPGEVLGVINLDMFGYDSDNDHCFEMHVGELEQSSKVAACFIQAGAAHDLGLQTYDYLTERATSRSDHGSFWKAGIGAVEILENMFDNDLPDGCQNADPNPHYHSPQDTADRLNPDSAVRITRAALAAVSAMAGPMQ